MQNSNDKRIRVRDLPLYSSDHGKSIVYVNLVHQKGEFEHHVSQVRQAVFNFIDKFSEQKERAKRFYDTGVAHSQTSLDYVRSETNILPKLTFITLSGLGGLLLGFKRSKLRKILYSSLFGTGALALCYPNEAKLYSKSVYNWTLNQTKSKYDSYFNIGYSSSDTLKAPSARTIANENNSKDQVLSYKSSKESIKETQIEGDKGQASDDDSDMYTTRK